MRELSRLAAQRAEALEGLRRRATHTIMGDDLLALTLPIMDVREIRRADEPAAEEDGPQRLK